LKNENFEKKGGDVVKVGGYVNGLGRLTSLFSQFRNFYLRLPGDIPVSVLKEEVEQTSGKSGTSKRFEVIARSQGQVLVPVRLRSESEAPYQN